MPELNFKGKEFVYNHHLTVPFRPLEIHADKGIGAPSLDENLIIHGDNLHALKALLPTHAGKVDCVFIDPPYNTGNEGWRYNDNVNSPMIKEWMDENPIGIEDGLRHDKWCAMMWPRLRLLFDLLSDDGVIFTCIDDNELYNLRLMLNEISTGESNWIGTIIWKNVTDNNPTRIAVEHEYIICFAKNKNAVEKIWKSKFSDIKELLIKTGSKFAEMYPDQEEMQSEYTKWFRANRAQLWPLDRYKYIDKDGIYTGSQSVHNPGKEGYRYDVIHPKTKKPCKQPLMGYRFPEQTMNDLMASGKILFGDDEDKIIELKVYARDYLDKLPSVIDIDGRTAAYELRDIFPDRKKAFDNPKPTQLVENILSFIGKPNALILDSFAGSGTTGHAVMLLNAGDGGSRRFILVEGEGYADELTRERIWRVAAGVPDATSEPLKSGLGGTFTYCTLGDAIDMDGLLTGQDLPAVESLAALLYHTATAKALDATALTPAPEIGEGVMRLGEANGRHLWLFYKPDLEWLKSGDAALSLSRARAIAATAPGNHLVFAPAKFVSRELLAHERLAVEYAPLPFSLYRVETA